MSTIIRIIIVTMKSAEIEILIEEHHERERAKRDERLRVRLSRPCSREELLMRLGGLSSPGAKAGAGEILLTNFMIPYILYIPTTRRPSL